jgi:uncharacterized protein
MSDRSTTTPHPAGIRAFVARHPVTAFLIMAFAIAYPVMSLLALAVHRVIPGGQLLDRLPVPPDETVGLMLTMFALLPSALFVTWAADGRPGVASLFKRTIRWRFGVGWWLAILAGLPVLTVLSALILGGSLESIEPSNLFWDQLRLLLINFILVNLWEETAWAGVMQTRLERRHNVFVAAVLPQYRSDSSTCRSPSSARSPSHRYSFRWSPTSFLASSSGHWWESSSEALAIVCLPPA